MSPESASFPKPPFVVVANHGTFFDPWIVGVYSSFPLVYMVNDDGFRGKTISSWYLRSIGSIPKKKGASDYKAMKAAMTALREKKAVFIFPEGQTTWDGETQPLYKGLEKIVKKVNCPLVMARLQGNFLIKPWWAKTLRKGNIRITMKVLTTPEISSMDTEQIFDTIKTYIYQNDIKDPLNRSIPFQGTELAEGLENFVWICMHCKSEDSLHTRGNTITCNHCHHTWSIDAHCRLTSETQAHTQEDLWEWSSMHKTEVKRRLEQKPSILTKTDTIKMFQENEHHEFTYIDTGTLTLTPETLIFSSPAAQYTWEVSSINNYVIQKKNIFEFGVGSQTYRFVFDKNSPMKWVYYFRYMNNFEQCEKQGYY
jgi:hypothetical protein